MMFRTRNAGLLLTASLLAITATTTSFAQTAPPDPRIEEMQQQIEALRAEVEALKAARAAAAPTPAPVAAAPVGAAQAQVEIRAQAAPTAADSVKFTPSPQWTSADKAFSFKLRGRVELDAAAFSVRKGERDFNNGTELRRARLGAEGTMFTDWAYRLEADISGAGRDDRDGQEVDVKDATIQYLGVKNLTITAGQHKTPNSLEQLTGTPSLTFMERASANEALLDRRNSGGDFKLGLSAAYSGRNWSLTGGVFGENVAITGADGADEGYGFNGRLVVTPINDENRLLHLGVSGFWRDTGGRGMVRFGDKPEVHVDNARLVDTGPLLANDYTFVGAEFLGALGPVFLQSEYNRTHVDARGAQANPSFDGGYVTVGWFLTGERLAYKNGTVGRLKPKHDFSPKDGGWGAFELAARYSTLDLNDASVEGGRSENVTVGLNWYVNPFMRVLVNWVRFDTTRQGMETDGDAFATRFAINW